METDDKQQHLLFPNNKSRGSKKNEKEDEDSEIGYDAEDLGILLLNKGVVSKSGEVRINGVATILLKEVSSIYLYFT